MTTKKSCDIIKSVNKITVVRLTKNFIGFIARKDVDFMKFTVLKNGKEIEMESIGSNLRAGFMRATNAEGVETEVVSSEKFQSIVNTYVDTLVSHGVRSFVYAFEQKGEVHYYRMIPSDVKTHARELYSFNTDGKFLALTYRATRTEIECLQEYGQEIFRTIAEDLLKIQEEANLGYKAEVLLYGKSQHKKTYSDGKSYNKNGKKENSQLKASCRNSSRSRSKSHNIWSARYEG